MVTVIMTSDAIDGQVSFEYNENGYLAAMIIDAYLTIAQMNFLSANLPWLQTQIESLKNKTKKATFVVTDREITFDMFWNRYNDKSRSSKKKTETQWDKLSKTDQVKAYMYIPVYLNNKGAAEKKYATTYLSDELWNN